MLSMKDSPVIGSSNRTVAAYKGLKVAVYTVDKTELSLNRTDLIELVRVCVLFTAFTQSYMHIVAYYMLCML